jgi:hypothetical protein
MKRSRLFMACGTILLTSVGIFASKANKTFDSVLTAKVGSSQEVFLYNASGSRITTTKPLGGAQVSINVYTLGGHIDISTGVLSGALFTAARIFGNIDLYWE